MVKGGSVRHQNFSAAYPDAIREIIPVIGPDTVPIQIGKAAYVIEKVGRSIGAVAIGENDSVLGPVLF